MKWNSFLSINESTYPNKVALVVQNKKIKLTYKDLGDLADSWALFLEEKGVKKGDRVAILAQNRLEHLSLLFAVSRIGAILVPLNFRLATEEINSILDRIEAKVFFGECENSYSYNGHYINLERFDFTYLEDLLEANPSCKVRFDNLSSTLDDDILMLFTSGSTGVPKGVMMHGKMLLTNQIETSKNWELNSNDVTMVETPFFHTGGYNVLCLPLLYLGGTVVLASKFDVENVFDTFEREKVTVYFGVPTMFQMIRESEKFNYCDFLSLRFFISGGAACPVELIESYQEKNLSFKQGFGLTEVGPNCFLLGPEDAIRKLGSIGRAMGHSDVLVLKCDGSIAGVNEEGELLIKGDHLCHNYFNDTEKFNSSLRDGYFRTGDLVKFDEDGFFYVVGRIKDMYISGGENVYPGEVEKQLVSIPHVKEAVVVSVPSQKWGEVGYAFLQTEGVEFSIETIKDRLSTKLSRYKQPHYVKCLEELPLLANGKINRVRLKEMARG